jgi:hypothetical protein
MTVRGLTRFLMVAGLLLVLAAAYVTREHRPHTTAGELGLIAALTIGFLSAIVGAGMILREHPPADPARARRAQLMDRATWKALIPPVAGGAIILTFFALTNRWTRLDNPVASQVALVAGILGAVVGMLVDRVSRWDLVLIPLVLLALLLAFGDRLPIDSATTSRGEVVTLLVIVVLLVGIAINIPQFVRGRRRATS